MPIPNWIEVAMTHMIIGSDGSPIEAGDRVKVVGFHDTKISFGLTSKGRQMYRDTFYVSRVDAEDDAVFDSRSGQWWHANDLKKKPVGQKNPTYSSGYYGGEEAQVAEV